MDAPPTGETRPTEPVATLAGEVLPQVAEPPVARDLRIDELVADLPSVEVAEPAEAPQARRTGMGVRRPKVEIGGGAR